MNRKGRIKILSIEEVEQLYSKPIFNQKEREEFFSLDAILFDQVKSISKFENQLYFILTIGYFRYKPVITQFDLKDAKDDIQYICELYFSGVKPKLQPIPSSTHFRLTSQVVNLLGFQQINSESQSKLENRLKDVATISIDPRYMFDESIAFFGQERIALTGYSSIQKTITKVLSDERKRVEAILSKHMTKPTIKTLQIILRDKKRLNTLSNYKGSARGFNASELDKELNTHAEIKPIYPELKRLIDELKLSRGNMRYYASIVQYRSVYKLRRMSKWQAILYLMCYLYYRYRENNDRLVTAFRYLVTKHLEARRHYAKEAIADELEIVRSKLKHAGGILNLFVDDEIDDQIEFGQIRKQAFDFVKKSDVQLLSKYLNKNSFDKVAYRWQYTDKQHQATNRTLRKLFESIDIECESKASFLAQQIVKSKEELQANRKLKTVFEADIPKRELSYLKDDNDEIIMKRFEFSLYQRIVNMLSSGKVFVSESEQNKRLEHDLIPPNEWNNNQLTLIDKTGLTRLQAPIATTLQEMETKFHHLLDRVTTNINANAYEFVTHKKGTTKLTWSLANKRNKISVDPTFRMVI